MIDWGEEVGKVVYREMDEYYQTKIIEKGEGIFLVIFAAEYTSKYAAKKGVMGYKKEILKIKGIY